MRYILTLLKDLPNYPAGTQFRYRHEHEHGIFDRSQLRGPESYMELLESDRTYDNMRSQLLIPEKIIDDPVWVKKEVDYSTSMDLKCPVCGETKGHIIICGMTMGNRDDGYYNDADVFFEYDCGHELRQLYSSYAEYKRRLN